jgi:hypothetical protein
MLTKEQKRRLAELRAKQSGSMSLSKAGEPSIGEIPAQNTLTNALRYAYEGGYDSRKETGGGLLPQLTTPAATIPTTPKITPTQPIGVKTPVTPAPTTLTAEQKIRLVELRQKKTGQSNELQNISSEQLFSNLGGFLPESIRPKTYLPSSKEIQLTEPKRQSAYNELVRRGYDQTQIKTFLDIGKKIEAPRYGRMAGGTVGGILGPLILGQIPPFTALPEEFVTIPLTAAIVAGLGGTAGETVQTAIEEKRLPSKREALRAFAVEAGTESGGRYAQLGLKFLISPFVRKTIPEAAALVDDFAKVGGSFSPSELDKRMSIYMAEGGSRGSFGAKQIWDTFEKKQGAAARVFADNIVDSIAEGTARETPENLAQIFASDISRPNGRIMKILDDLVNPLYKQVDDMTKTATVATRRLKLFAKAELATDTRLNNLYLSSAGRNQLTKIIGMPDQVTFSDMRILRSTFLGDVRQMARDVDKAEGIIKHIANLTDEAMFDFRATKGLSVEAEQLLRNTNALYRAGKEGIKTTFSEKLLKNLIKNPSNVVAESLSKQNPIAIRNLRIALTEPIGGMPSKEGQILWNQLRTNWLADAVEKSFTEEGFVKPNAFTNIIKYKMGEKAVGEMFPEKTSLEGINKIKNLFEIISKKPPAGVSLYVRGIQTGGLYMMYKGAKEGDYLTVAGGGVLAMGPMAFARLSTNPTGIKLLTAGFSMKPGSSAVAPIAARMINLLNQMDKQEKSAQSQARIQQKLKTEKEQAQKIAETALKGL